MPIFSARSSLSVKAYGLTVLSAFITIIDNFNRANSSDLGSPGPGQSWKVWRGEWGILSNKASSSTAANQYPMATLTFTNEAVTVGVGSPDVGTGISFWVTDADNWYASIYVQKEVCGTCTNCNSWNVSNCNQIGGGNCLGWTCNSAFCNSWNSSNCNAFSGGNCKGWTCNASTCNGGWNASNCNAFGGGNCAARNPSTCNARGQGPCVAWNNRAPKGFCSSRNPGPCNAWSLGSCNSFNPITCTGNFNPSTCNGWTCNSSSCTGGFNAIFCSGNFNPSNCNAWFCNASNCTGGFNPTFCAGTFNPSNCNSFFSFTCGCQTENRINIVSSVASSISTVVSTLWSSTIASFKAVIGGSTVTIKAYSSSNYTSQIGTDSNQTISSPQQTKRFGIIKGPSELNQGSAIDEFRVE